MAKILVYEDNVDDLISRYSCLTSGHDVHVRWDSFRLGEFTYEALERVGFKRENITQYRDNPEEETADVFFLDGLKGMCINIIKHRHLPRDKTFIYSDDFGLTDAAKQAGYNIVEEPIKQIIERVCKGASSN